jgi:hypothetical protein
MERIASLSTGTKLMLASGSLLFFDLFLTWQHLRQQYGRYDVTANLDGWDRWGLLLGLLTLALLTIVVLRETEVELSADVPWNRIVLGLTTAMLVVAVLKNLTDADSAWASYLGVLLAGVALVGAYFERDRPEPEVVEKPLGEKWKPSVRTSAGQASSGNSAGRIAADAEPPAAEPARRW